MKKAVALLLILCTLLTLAGCEHVQGLYHKDKLEMFQNFIIAGEGSKAWSYYDANLASSQADQVRTFLLDYLSGAANEFSLGNYSESQYLKVLGTVSSFDAQAHLLADQILPIQRIYARVCVSRDTYEQARAFYESGSYYNAFLLAQEVSTEDRLNYMDSLQLMDSARNAYIQQTWAQAEALEEEGLYAEAIELLDETSSRLHTEAYCSGLYYELYPLYYEAQLTALLEEGETRQALVLYMNAQENPYFSLSEELTKRLDKLKVY